MCGELLISRELFLAFITTMLPCAGALDLPCFLFFISCREARAADLYCGAGDAGASSLVKEEVSLWVAEWWRYSLDPQIIELNPSPGCYLANAPVMACISISPSARDNCIQSVFGVVVGESELQAFPKADLVTRAKPFEAHDQNLWTRYQLLLSPGLTIHVAP